MIDYQEFSAQFIKENRTLKRILGITLIVNGTILVLCLLQKQYFVYQGGPVFKEEALIEDVCLSALKGIAKDNPNVHEVTSEIIKLIEKEPFSMDIQKVYQVISLKNNACKVVLQADGKLQAFKVIMKANESFPFHYKLSEIVELAPNKEEL